METVKILRQPSSLVGTLGVLWKTGLFYALTLEPVNPIPAGTYIAKRCIHHPNGPHPYTVYGLQNVPGHSDIHAHIGCTIYDTEGCILLGDHIDDIQVSSHGYIRGINLSKDTFGKFMAETDGDIQIIIEDYPNVG